jgi:RNA polymerase sigma-70 factor (ECF subfamily)
MSSLLERISQNDPQAFKIFYEYTYPQLFRIACYFLSNSEDRKDLISDVYMNLWKNRHSINGIRNIDNYLFISVRNNVMRTRAEKITYQHIQIEDSGLDTHSMQFDPEKELLNNELKEVLELAINSLPDRCRLIFLMVREEEMKYKDVSEVLSISEKTVQAQMIIAVKKIGVVLKNYLSTAKQEGK